VLLVSTHRGVQTVAACCEAAAAAGVRAGITLAHARSLLGHAGAEVRPFTPRDDALGLCRLARWALRFSPVAAPDEPDGLLLDISGCQRLYADESQHLTVIFDALRELGLTARLAVAPTFGCAWAVARYGDKTLSIVSPESVLASLSPLPVAALRIDEPARIALAAVNVTRIGELMAIPRAALADRFGAALLTRLDQALGRAFESTESIKPAETFAATWTFDGPIEDRAIIEHTVRGLLNQLLDSLRAKGLGVSELIVELCSHHGSPTQLTFPLTYPTCQFDHLWTLLRNRLETFRVAHPVEIVRLRAARTRTLADRQRALFDNALALDRETDAPLLGALVDQLVDRLGARSVVRFEPRETYTPECAFASTAAVIPKQRRSQSAPVVNIFAASRPSLLLDRPVAIEVMALLPDSPPAWFRWRGRELRVAVGCGPERIASRWWLRGMSKSTGGQAASGTPGVRGKRGLAPSPSCAKRSTKSLREVPVPFCHNTADGTRAQGDDARDYYAVQTECGGVFWLFRLVSTGQWFVHGLWA